MFTVIGLESTRSIAFIMHFLRVFLNRRIRGVAFFKSYTFQSWRPVVFFVANLALFLIRLNKNSLESTVFS